MADLVDRDRHVWYAERLVRGGRDAHVRYELRDLLDVLGAK